MMLTFRAGKVAALAVCLSLAACSREQQDWRAAEAADTVESYDQFLEHHPDSELVTAARTRLAQLTEDREWKQAGSADTADAYREFLAHHPNGKWAQEARIRIQNFALNGLSAQGAPEPETAGTPAGASAAAAPAAAASTSAQAPAEPAGSAAASPGELAQPAAGAPLATQLATPYISTPRSPAGVDRPVATNIGGTPVNAAAVAIPTATGAVNSPTAAVPTATRAANAGPAPVATTAPAGYGIQLGAFTSETAANTAWQQLTARFGAQLQGLSPQLVPANTANGTLFRLQARVPDEPTARALCDVLRQQSQACVPVLPH